MLDCRQATGSSSFNIDRHGVARFIVRDKPLD
jgi:hypothetical protein